MINQKILDEFNEQIKYEIESAYFYMSMSAWLQAESYDGMAAWMQAQAIEELEHALKFQNHVIDRGGKVIMQPLGMKKTSWKSPLEVFKDTLEHEEFVTSRINGLVELAIEVKDRAARTFLTWFVDEQIEEEASASKIVTDLERIGDFGYGLVMLDREMGQRQISSSSAE